MGILNWRREVMFIALAGMETCWVVAWSRFLLKHPGSDQSLISWWSAFALYLFALTAARTVGRWESPRGNWLIAVLALFSSLVLIGISLGKVFHFLQHPSDPSSGLAVLTLLFGFLVWFRALRIVDYAGATRDTIRQFQIGLLVLVAGLLATLRFPNQLTDLVIVYFGFGLLAVALTRVEDVAQTEPGGAGPLNLKWIITLAATLLAVGGITLLATQVITIETVRWALRPLVTLLQAALFVVVVLATSLLFQILPLLSRLFDRIPTKEVEETMQFWRENASPFPQTEQTEGVRLSAQLVDALQFITITVLVLAAMWLVARSFRRWRSNVYATPGGVRETVPSEGALVEDLIGYLRDQWQRLQGVDLRRLFQRFGTESVRAIYASFLALMAAAGQPRQPEQTPYEYEPVVKDALPVRQADITSITEAYVRVRYGEKEIGAEELAELQEAWERIQTDGKELL